MRYLGLCIFMALASWPAIAQDAFRKPRPSVFVLVAPGSLAVNHGGNSSLELGGGGTFFLYRGLGLEAEAGALRFGSRDLEGRSVQRWTAMLTADLVYSFQRSEKQKICPFLVAGVTGIPEFDVAGGLNFGGGLHYWLRRHYGIRLEFREHVRSEMRTYHDLQARIAAVFRR